MLPVRFPAPVLTVTAGLLASATVLAGPQLNLGLVSEYMRDGISQTNGEYAMQAGADYTHNSGLYAGAALYELKHQSNSTNYERDLFAGYYRPLTDHLALDMALTRYNFHGSANAGRNSYNELSVRALMNDSLTLGWRHTHEFMGSHFPKRTLELAYTWPLDSFGLEFYTAQHRYLGIDEDYNFGSSHRDTYWHFRVAVERTWNQYDYRLSIERTNLTRDYDGGTKIQFGIHRYFSLY